MTDRYYKNTKEGIPICEINRRTKNGKYMIRKESWQRKYVRAIQLHGFDTIPTGFRRDGHGLTSPGWRLLKTLGEKFSGPIRVTVSSREPSNVITNKKSHRIILSHSRLLAINREVRKIERERNSERDTTIATFLSAEFPRQFPKRSSKTAGYNKGTLATMLDSPKIEKHLSDEDRTAVLNIHSKLIATTQFTLKSLQKVQLIKDDYQASQKLYLGRIIKEFQTKLRTSPRAEQTWQRFLSEHILILINSYTHFLQKQNISTRIDYPDFLLIDPYNYIDIYEIKTPATKVLGYDASRHNYYWSAEISKAISQVENYRHQLARNGSNLREDIEKLKGIKVELVRPRGYIIAGTRKQLGKPIMKDNFRLLNDALKNVDMIFYDDLLKNLKLLQQRLAKGK